MVMRIRVHLRTPGHEPVVRDVVSGRWEEPAGDAEDTIGEGLWALPGLVDAHAHLASDSLYQPGDLQGASARARAALGAGVILVLDKGWMDRTTLEVIDTVPAGERPEIEAAGRVITVVDGYFPGFAREIDPKQVAARVGRAAEEGAGWVKLIGDWPRKGKGPVANFGLEELKAAVEAAEMAGASVAIHTMAREVPSWAVAAGVHSIEHGLFLETDDIAVLGGRGGMWVPTVQRVETLVTQLGSESSGGRLMLEGLSNMRRLLPLAVEAGVHVLAGTDLVGSPADVAAEAIKLGEMGLSPVQVVEAVSTSGFAATGRRPDFAIGESADAVLFDHDPTEELSVLAHPSHIIRRGVVR